MFRSDMLYIEDILEFDKCYWGIVSVLDFKAFSNDRKTSSATIRELEVIGEAVGKISVELKTELLELVITSKIIKHKVKIKGESKK